MGSFFDRLMHRQPKSATQAKDRLKLVLSHDRADLPPGILEELKDEIVEIISRRIEIDPGAVRIQMTHDGREQRLIADIPLRPTRKRRMG